MKNIVLGFLLLLVLGITSCHKTDQVNPTGDPLKEHTQDMRQAKLWLPGKWKLTKVWAMIPNPSVPNVVLEVDQNQIKLIQNGNQTDQVTYEVIKLNGGLQIKTDAQPREDNWYIRNPSLYINRDRMFFDLGVATDGPGYEFSRLN